MGIIRDSDNDGSILDDGLNTACVLSGTSMMAGGSMLAAGGAGLAALGFPAMIAPPAGVTALGVGTGIGLMGTGIGALGTLLAGAGSTGVPGEIGQAAVPFLSGAAESVGDFFSDLTPHGAPHFPFPQPY